MYPLIIYPLAPSESRRGGEEPRDTLYSTFPASNGCKNGGRTMALEGRQEHPIEVEDSLEDGDDSDDEDGGVDLDEVFQVILREENLAPVPVPAPGVVYQLVLIEDLEEEEEEDLEIEEGLAIEIAALDPAPAYTE